MQRRDFLQATLGTAAGTIPLTVPSAALPSVPDNRPPWLLRYEQMLSASPDLELLGIPKSWWHVHQGLHPFTPERTLILPDDPQRDRPDYPYGGARLLEQQIMDELEERRTPYTKLGVRQIIHAASILTQTYQLPERLNDWSQRMAMWLYYFYSTWAREHVWFTEMSWQGRPETVRTMNGVVDWWLILIPGGIDVDNLDGTRTHVLLTPVYSRYDVPRHHGDFWIFMSQAVKPVATAETGLSPVDPIWLRISRMDRRSACLCVNEIVAGTLSQPE